MSFLSCLLLALYYASARALPSSEVASPHELQTRESRYLNAKTNGFSVKGDEIPEVPFNIGESYAGNLPNTPSGNSSLYFWFFPSSNPAANNEILIWLNGGPGCSSLDGLLQENGPFLWQPGTYAPVRNPYSWTNLTNIVYVDQPAGTGFSPGPSTVTNDVEVSEQFMDFWKNFLDTFGMQNYSVYLSGESYAGQYIPYIADAMLSANDTMYFNVKGIQINDPAINDYNVLQNAPVVPAVLAWQNLLNLNTTTLTKLIEAHESCNYSTLLSNGLTFPASGILPPIPPTLPTACANLWEDTVGAIYEVNPCFNYWHVTDTCPWPSDVLGLSHGVGPRNYFNLPAVKHAIHAPRHANWTICRSPQSIFHGSPTASNGGDRSPWSSYAALPSVIEQTKNVIVAHGALDFSFFANGTLLSIQNMTWAGHQGFQAAPSLPLLVPAQFGFAPLMEANNAPVVRYGASGTLGTVYSERGLTWALVQGAGHEIPQYVPGAAYRLTEALLGRITVGELSVEGAFTA